jgi:hypothetical protein
VNWSSPRSTAGVRPEPERSLKSLAAQGVTDLFIDLNFDPSIGHVDADPAASIRRAQIVLDDAFAPG